MDRPCCCRRSCTWERSSCRPSPPRASWPRGTAVAGWPGRPPQPPSGGQTTPLSRSHPTRSRPCRTSSSRPPNWPGSCPAGWASRSIREPMPASPSTPRASGTWRPPRVTRTALRSGWDRRRPTRSHCWPRSASRWAAYPRSSRPPGPGCRYPEKARAWSSPSCCTTRVPKPRTARSSARSSGPSARCPNWGFPIDVTFPGEGEPDELDERIAAQAEPFYIRA